MNHYEQFENSASEYTLTLEFELQREKEKNQILEERLKNKEIFMTQMKQMQLQLEELNEKCRRELHEERKMRENLEQNQLRAYAQRVAQLQHQVKLLKTMNLTQNQVKESCMFRNPSRQRITSNRQMHDSKVRKQSPHFRKISRDHSNDAEIRRQGEQEKDQEKKIRKFTSHFLSMAAFYIQNELKGVPESKKLKISWKWIKDVVKQWDQNRYKILELERCIHKIEQMLQLPKTGNTSAILETLELLGNFSKEENFQH